MANARLLKDHFYAQPGDCRPKPIQPYTCRAETNWINPTRPDSALPCLFPQHVSHYTHTHPPSTLTIHPTWTAYCWPARWGRPASGTGQDSCPLPTRPHRCAQLDLTCKTLCLDSRELAEHFSPHPHFGTWTCQTRATGDPLFPETEQRQWLPQQELPSRPKQGSGRGEGGTCLRAGQEAGCEARAPPSLRTSAQAKEEDRFGTNSI